MNASLVIGAGTAVAARADAGARTETGCMSGLSALEAALDAGLRQEWAELVAADPGASLFQTHGWCLPWYRCYADEYEPLLVTVRRGSTLVGLVPMAVERGTRKLVFASDSMADYRDIVALPAHRLDTVRALVEVYLEGRFPSPLQVGFIDPASDTPQLLARVCAERRLPSLVSHQPCYRWFPPPPPKPSAQKFLNWFKRQGDATFDVVEGDEAWVRFREQYYRQHSLRQLQAGRPLAFDDSRRTALYDQLFHSTEIQPHVTGFHLNGRLLAGHFGYVWRGVLLLGPPSIDLEHEQRSPSVILLSWIIQNAERLGLAGFDLTIGDSDFKKRLGNQCVQLTTVEVYGRRGAYGAQRARKRVMDAIKKLVARIAGPDAWKEKVKPAGAWLQYKLARIREDGVLASIKAAAVAAVSAVGERRVGHVYAIAPGEFHPAAPRLGPGDTFVVHDNRVEDLLLWNGMSLTTKSAITVCARSYARIRNTERTFHTAVLDGKLAGWGYSYYPTKPAQLTETPGATLEFEPRAVSLYDFHVIPEFRGRRIYQALLTHILEARFAEGATRAYITVLASNVASRIAIERLGFRVVAKNVYRRLLRRQSLTPLPVAPPSDSYEDYLRDEWVLFAADATRQQEALRAASGIEVRSVLDVGCGGGQDLIPFASSETRCVGIDVSHASGVWATKQFSATYPERRVSFTTGAAEYLPFADGSFDLVLCRVAIPYTDNRRALAEIGRVLRPGGVLLLKTHSLAYYVRKFAEGVRRRSPLFCVHALRVLLTGAVYHATGVQPRGGVLLRESFQGRRLLQKELQRAGLVIEGELADSNALTPSYRIAKQSA